MRFLFLHPNAWTGEYPLLAHLSSLGEDVCVLEERRGLGAARRREAHFRTPGDRIRTLWYDPGRGLERVLTWTVDRRYRRAFDGRNLAHRMRVICEAEREFQPEVIICSDGFSYAVPAAMLRRDGILRAPLITRCIGGDVLDVPEAELGHRRTAEVTGLLECVARHSDALRPVSPLLRDALLTLGADAARVEVLPSHLTSSRAALSEVRDAKAAARVAVRRRLSLADDAPLVVTLGYNYKGKGLQVLAQAWPAILTAFPAARWILAGPEDPWMRDGVWPLIRSRETVIATGRLSQREAYELLAAADLNIAPSLAEGLNMVVVEAAALETPSIVGSGAGVSAWVERLGFGEVVPSGDPEALASAVCRALSDPARVARWRAVCESVADEFALETIASRLRELAGRLVK